MIALESAGYDITLTVHDEVITETTKDLETFKRIMATPPAWGLDIPLKVGAWQSDRYRK
jgi:DNA polymerase